MTKKELRTYIKSLFPQFQSKLPAFSRQINLQIISSNAYKNSDIILAYMALPDEVDLSLLIAQSLKDKKQVYIPRIIPDTNKMDFYEFNHSKSLLKGSFGIDEPVPEGNILPIAHSCKNILVLVPGRAFTKKGARLGRGKGFYDNYLNKMKDLNRTNLLNAGVCFSFQIAEDLPVEEHDIRMETMFFNQE